MGRIDNYVAAKCQAMGERLMREQGLTKWTEEIKAVVLAKRKHFLKAGKKLLADPGEA